MARPAKRVLAEAIRAARRDGKAFMDLPKEEQDRYVKTVPIVAVDRESGAVSVNRTIVGRLVKEPRMGFFGPSVSKFDWTLFDVNGGQIPGTFTTREAALNALLRHVEPTRVDDMKLSTWGNGNLWEAELHWKGHCYGVDRRTGEAYWFIHFQFANGAIVPSLSTIPGTRPANAVGIQEAIDLLNEAANAKGANFPVG